MNNARPQIAHSQESLPSGATIIENVEDSLAELFFIENPGLKKRTPEIEEKIKSFIGSHGQDDCWIYYPSRNIVIHTVREDIYFRLRTSRNRYLITEEEQKKYRNLKIGIAGLSVGSAVLSAITISGGPKTIKIADFDVVEVTNLNRIRAALTDIGLRKTDVAAQKVWEIDPFAELSLFGDGLTRENLGEFILGDPRLDVFIDEMDSLDLKIEARRLCREHSIPVLMATDNGDGIILDVERFDLESTRKMFHGLIPEMKSEELAHLDYRDWLKLATKIVGPEYLTESMQDSILSIGKTIPSVPQLGTSAAMAGSAVSFALRKIASGEDMPSGRYTLGLEERLIPSYADPEYTKAREKKTKEFINTLSASS